MSSKRKPVVERAVDRHFQPPNAGRAARRQVFVALGTALLVLAAMNAEDWVSWLLWAWVAYRGLVFLMLLAVGGNLADAITKRLAALPAPWRAYLTGEAA